MYPNFFPGSLSAAMFVWKDSKTGQLVRRPAPRSIRVRRAMFEENGADEEAAPSPVPATQASQEGVDETPGTPSPVPMRRGMQPPNRKLKFFYTDTWQHTQQH